ncbi:uncharacterized protein LOC109461104 isoform X2 [Rhinolophus sinicus]|uniref:uncharacterized protein LOC109461104 isoform X2 n=1 Tax=Rhinolophus sinicus TaxID=89399 RepID=UPI003D78DDC0
MFPNPGAAGPHKNCLWDQESSHTEEPLFILGVSSLFSWNDVLLKKQSLGKSVHNCLPVPPSWVLFIEHQKELCQRKWSATAAGGLSDYGCSVLQLRKSLAVNPGFRKEDHSRPPELRRRGGRSAFFSSSAMFGSKDQREVTLSLASGGHRMMITTKVQRKCPEAGPGPTKVTAAVTGTVYKVHRTRIGGFQEGHWA